MAASEADFDSTFPLSMFQCNLICFDLRRSIAGHLLLTIAYVLDLVYVLCVWLLYAHVFMGCVFSMFARCLCNLSIKGIRRMRMKIT